MSLYERPVLEESYKGPTLHRHRYSPRNPGLLMTSFTRCVGESKFGPYDCVQEDFSILLPTNPFIRDSWT